jgi:hypothetical protein
MRLEYYENEKLLAHLEVFEKPNNIIYFGKLFSATQTALIELLKTLKQNYHDRTILGPIDNSTWFSYRIVSHSDNTPTFLMEPSNPLFYATALQTCGFIEKESYNSSITPLKAIHDPRADSVVKRLQKEDITIRNIRMDSFEDEVQKLYELTHNSFKNNPLYESISKEYFVSLYSAFKPLVHPELCKIVEHKNEIIGYMFAYLDTNRLIIKTTAFKPLKVSAGITLVLMEMMSKYALKKGATDIIYALMHNDNHSSKTAQKNAKVFRNYAVYEYTRQR